MTFVDLSDEFFQRRKVLAQDLQNSGIGIFLEPARPMHPLAGFGAWQNLFQELRRRQLKQFPDSLKSQFVQRFRTTEALMLDPASL